MSENKFAVPGSWWDQLSEKIIKLGESIEISLNDLGKRVAALEAKAKEPGKCPFPDCHEPLGSLYLPGGHRHEPSTPKPSGWRAREMDSMFVSWDKGMDGPCRIVEIHPRAVRVRMHCNPIRSDHYGHWHACYYMGVMASPNCPLPQHAEFLQTSSEPAP